HAFTRGCSPRWDAIVPHRTPISGPRYAWQRQRFWLGEDGPTHPILGREQRPGVFEGRLDPRAQSWLTEHRVSGTPILPASGWMELIAAAVGRHSTGIGLADLRLRHALPVDRPANLRTDTTGNTVEVQVQQPDRSWRSHASARPLAESVPTAAIDIAELQARCGVVAVPDFYRTLDEQGLSYGPEFRGIEALWASDTEALARLTARPRQPYVLAHPALLDAALQAMAAITCARPMGPWMPVRADRITSAPGEVSWAVVESRGPLLGDVFLLGAEGEIRVRIEGLQLRSVDADTSLLEVQWRPLSLPGAALSSRWRVLAPESHAADITAALTGALVDTDAVNPDGILYMGAGGESWAELLSLTRSLAASARPPRLVLLTCRADQDPDQAVLWGLGGVIAAEHRALRCLRVDLGHRDDLRMLPAVLASAGREDQLQLRDGAVETARLAPHPGLITGQGVIRADGSYLVTGGLGGMGLLTARWLAEQGAGHIVLVGRSGAKTTAQVEAVEALGASTAAADVTDAVALQAVLNDLPEDRPLRGIFHAAAVLEDATINHQTDAAFRRVLAPRVQGARNLDALSRQWPVDVFAMFTSGAARLGSAGQGSYVAACTAVEAVVRARRAAGLPGIAIAWGAIAEVGLAAASAGRGARLAERGIEPLSVTAVGQWLTRLIGSDAVVASPMPFNARRWIDFSPMDAGWPLLDELESGVSRSVEASLPDLSVLTGAARKRALRAWVRDQIAAVTRLPTADIGDDTPLTELGLDSLMGLEVRNRLEALGGEPLPATLIWTHPSVAALADHLDSDQPEAVQVVAAVAAPEEAIAVVGLSCRFPGGATPDRFWQSLVDGVDSVVPLDRFPTQGAFAGLLKDIDTFDPGFFGITPREARTMDPQHRLLLEVSWMALEDASIDASSHRTGTFIGISSADYRDLLVSAGELSSFGATGNGPSFAAGRLAYILGLNGPTMAIDTACSSSLVAVHQAAQSLRSGECDLALAGGVNLILAATTQEFVQQTQALSPDGRCKTFDASANGFVRGEGCGVVVLKRLSDAVSAGDRIWGVVSGSAVNQDGRSAGLTA
ncbi:MAG: acyl transferase domain-containing protein, partial [Myxococcota bacterium]